MAATENSSSPSPYPLPKERECPRDWWVSWLGRLGYPVLDSGLKDVEGQGAVCQHLIVKLANVKSRAQLFRRQRTQFFILQLANLVSQCLSRPNDVTIHFHRHVV